VFWSDDGVCAVSGAQHARYELAIGRTCRPDGAREPAGGSGGNPAAQGRPVGHAPVAVPSNPGSEGRGVSAMQTHGR
jgi:hypothetical protein